MRYDAVITIRLPQELKEELQDHCEFMQASMAQIVRDLIEDTLDYGIEEDETVTLKELKEEHLPNRDLDELRDNSRYFR